jgi:GT2 family glycosyltransferase
MTRIDLCWLSTTPGDERPRSTPPWTLGEVAAVARSPAALAAYPLAPAADFLLCWDADLGRPDSATVLALAASPGDVWHAGLALGMGGRPGLLDHVHPTWMLQRDPPIEVAASSWRLSLRAVLVRAEVWRQLGPPLAAFRTLEAAGLELGHRYLWGGALPRHHAELCPAGAMPVGEPMPLADELLFLRLRAGRFWMGWAWWRALLGGSRRPATLWRGWRELPAPVAVAAPPAAHFAGSAITAGSELAPRVERISVLIPTLDRYRYLEVLLGQLSGQTLPSFEILLVDQTSPERRRRDWPQRFPDLPLVYLEQDEPGQCTSRNAGLLAMRGDAVLFLDDDDEVPPDLLERHAEALARSGAEVCCGAADEVGQGELPAEFRRRRLSDVLPTNNCLVLRSALERSGLFDLAFERGARADADLGHRLYLAGALMVLEPSIRVLHHHAPAGGLRQHGARVATYGASRRSVRTLHLPSATEIYLAMRYFTERQVREALWLRVVGTFAVRGGPLRRLLKAVWAGLLLPRTLWRVAASKRAALELVRSFPRFPRLPGAAP